MARRRKSRKSNVGVPKSKTKRAIKQEQDYICPLCDGKGNDHDMDIHHKQARSKGGSNHRSNLVAWHKKGHREYHQDNGNQTSDDYGNPID